MLQAKDELKNRRLCGGDTFVVRLEGPSAVDGSVEDHGDGTYTATYQVSVAGTYTLSVTNGQPRFRISTFICWGLEPGCSLLLRLQACTLSGLLCVCCQVEQ